MPFRDILRVAFLAIRVNSLRSMLTMLGIIIGVAALITMVSLGTGAQKSVQARIEALGPDLLTLFPGQSMRMGVASESRVSLTVDDAAGARARRARPQGGGPRAHAQPPGDQRQPEHQRERRGHDAQLRGRAALCGGGGPHVLRRRRRGAQTLRRRGRVDPADAECELRRDHRARDQHSRHPVRSDRRAGREGVAGILRQPRRADTDSPRNRTLPHLRNRPPAFHHRATEGCEPVQRRHDRCRARAASRAQDPPRRRQRFSDPASGGSCSPRWRTRPRRSRASSPASRR